eukprot:6479557-Amphidinium_carterae.1
MSSILITVAQTLHCSLEQLSLKSSTRFPPLQLAQTLAGGCHLTLPLQTDTPTPERIYNR